LRPLALLLGIAMGSAISLTAGLALTVVVFLALPEYRERLHGELSPLLEGLLWAVALASTASASFVGEIRAKSWRRPVQLVFLIILMSMSWHFWP